MIYYVNSQFCPISDLRCFDLIFTVGASGAPTIVRTNGVSRGVNSVTRTNTGRYRVTLGSSLLPGVPNFQIPAGARINSTVSLDLGGASTVYPTCRFSLSTSADYLFLAFVTPTVSAGPSRGSAFAELPEGTTVRVQITVQKVSS